MPWEMANLSPQRRWASSKVLKPLIRTPGKRSSPFLWATKALAWTTQEDSLVNRKSAKKIRNAPVSTIPDTKTHPRPCACQDMKPVFSYCPGQLERNNRHGSRCVRVRVITWRSHNASANYCKLYVLSKYTVKKCILLITCSERIHSKKNAYY